MKKLTLAETHIISGGVNVRTQGIQRQFDNMDVALTTAGFIAPLLINKVTFYEGSGSGHYNKTTGLSFVNFFWAPTVATMGLIVSKTLKKIDSLLNI